MLSRINQHLTLATFTVFYMIAWTLIGLALNRPQVWTYLTWMILAAGFVAWVDSHIRFSTPVLVVLSLVGFAHMAGGNVTVDPETWGWARYDLAVHFFAMGAAGLAAWETVRARTAIDPRFGPLIVILAANSIGAWVEIGEYGIGLANPTARMGDYANNMTDLIANAIGGLVAAWWQKRLSIDQSKTNAMTTPSNS